MDWCPKELHLKKAATYSPALHCSTIGASGLNFSVRNGKRWDTTAITTWLFRLCHLGNHHDPGVCVNIDKARIVAACVYAQDTLTMHNHSWKHGPHEESFRAISTARLWRHRLYTCRLSTSSSATTLNGALILRMASHLDAFSAYPNQTRIPGGAPGGTTGLPEVCPSRSSRTSDGTAQNSCAHDR